MYNPILDIPHIYIYEGENISLEYNTDHPQLQIKNYYFIIEYFVEVGLVVEELEKLNR